MACAVAWGETKPERGVMAPAPWGWGGGIIMLLGMAMAPRREVVQLLLLPVALRGEWWRALAPGPPQVVRGVAQRLL